MNRALPLAAALSLLALASPTIAQPRCDPAAPELCDLPVRSQIQQPDLAHAVDIVLVGDGFTSFTEWRAAADDMIDTLRAQTNAHLLNAAPQLFNFHVVDLLSQTNRVTNLDTTDTALGSRASGSEIITINQYRASLAASNAPDVDVVFTISNTLEGRANAYYPSGIATGGSVRMSLQMDAATHELGHALIRLADEYTEDSRCELSPESSLVDLRNVTGDATCHKFQSTPGAACVRGNHYCRRDRYRAASQCLMRATGDTAPCPVCRRAMDEVLLQRRTGRDAAEPWVVLHAPAPNATVSGQLQVQVVAWDSGYWPVTVAIDLDGAWLASLALETSSGELVLDSSTWAEGPHTLTATITDRAGHTRRGAPTPITVQNSSDQTAPDLQLLFPSPGATLSGSTLLSAQALQNGLRATDNELIAAWLDDHLLGASAGSFLSFTWDTAPFAPGLHHLTLLARDASQNQRRTDPIPLLIEPTPPPTRVILEISSPTPWSAVGDLLLLQLTLRDLPDDADLALWLDDTPLLPLPRDAAALLLDTAAWPQGPHQLTLIATANGHTWRSAPRPIVRTAPTKLTSWLLPDPLYIDAQSTQTLAAAGPDPIASFKLESDAYGLLATSTQNPARLTLDTSALPEGCFSARAVATDTAGRTAASAWQERCVSHQPPQVTLDPLGPALSEGPHLARARSTNGALTLPTALSLWVDGAQVAASPQPEAALPFALAPGPHLLQARATDALGRAGQSPTLTVQVQRCGSDADCDDGRRCTADRCSPAGRCLNAPQQGCCDSDADCDDGDRCTNDTCADNACAHDRAPGCCNHDGDCQGPDPCALGRCLQNTCQTLPNPACCDGDADCDDARACTADTCIAPGRCANDRAPGCCDLNEDCDDNNPCTLDACVSNTCQNDALPGCCLTDTDCDDADPCTSDACQQNTCAFAPNPACCRSDADCASLDPCVTATCDLQRLRCAQTRQANCCTFNSECDDANACTADTCGDGACLHTDTCCRDDADCDDNNPCTNDTCDDGACLHPLTPGCCLTDTDCDDNNPCTSAQCVSNACQIALTPGCCLADLDCDDADPCTEDTCADNACAAAPIPGCCLDDADCDDDNLCTADACDQNACAARGVPGCCAADADCDDDNPCTLDACQGDTCAFTPAPGCCLRREDCDDNDPCTADACVSNTCQNAALLGCCRSDEDCDDGNVCTLDTCADNACASQRNLACCLQDLDCDDGNLCTLDACADNTCQRRGVAGCCFQDAHCDDADPCTTDTCVNNACAHAPSGNCCLTDADCDDGDLCSQDYCEANQCRRRRIPDCCLNDTDCDDGDPCTADACLDNRCRVAQQLDCCLTDDDCDDGDPCTADLCQGDACLFAQQPRCCLTDDDCDDANPCTANACLDNACQTAPVPGCCLIDADCDDADPCTADQCDGGACASSPTPGCCRSDADCDDDNPCTADQCVSMSCQNAAAPGCCLTDADCDDDNLCTNDQCQQGACAYDDRPGCCLTDDDCDDDDPCTANTCEGGSCALDPIPGCCLTDTDCDDDDPCTLDQCVSASCQNAPRPCPDASPADEGPPPTRRPPEGCATATGRLDPSALLLLALALLTRTRSSRQRATPPPPRQRP